MLNCTNLKPRILSSHVNNDALLTNSIVLYLHSQINSLLNFRDIDGVLKRANATEYGLASGVFTKDLSKALRFAEKVEAGTVFVNTYNKTDVAVPFGGFKQSGFGKDLGNDIITGIINMWIFTFVYLQVKKL